MIGHCELCPFDTITIGKVIRLPYGHKGYICADCFLIMREYAQTISKKKKLSAPLLRFAKLHECQQAQADIIASLDGIAYKQIEIMRNEYKIDCDDLKSVSDITVLGCIKKFSPRRGCFNFPKYARVAIYFALKRYSCLYTDPINYNETTILSPHRRRRYPLLS